MLGEVEDVNIVEQNTIGPFRYGFITLKTQEDVDYCMQMEYVTIKGQQISIKKFKRKKKKALKKREKMVMDDEKDLRGSNKSKKGSNKSR